MSDSSELSLQLLLCICTNHLNFTVQAKFYADVSTCSNLSL